MTITLDMTKLNFVRSADQIAGKSAFLINGKLEDLTAMLDLYDERLRRLTKAQRIGVFDFVKYTGAKLLISLSSCAAWGRSICARQRRSSASATTMA